MEAVKVGGGCYHRRDRDTAPARTGENSQCAAVVTRLRPARVERLLEDPAIANSAASALCGRSGAAHRGESPEHAPGDSRAHGRVGCAEPYCGDGGSDSLGRCSARCSFMALAECCPCLPGGRQHSRHRGMTHQMASTGSTPRNARHRERSGQRLDLGEGNSVLHDVDVVSQASSRGSGHTRNYFRRRGPRDLTGCPVIPRLKLWTCTSRRNWRSA